MFSVYDTVKVAEYTGDSPDTNEAQACIEEHGATGTADDSSIRTLLQWGSLNGFPRTSGTATSGEHPRTETETKQLDDEDTRVRRPDEFLHRDLSPKFGPIGNVPDSDSTSASVRESHIDPCVVSGAQQPHTGVCLGSVCQNPPSPTLIPLDECPAVRPPNVSEMTPPSWFLERCVKTSRNILDGQAPLVLRNSEAYNKASDPNTQEGGYLDLSVVESVVYHSIHLAVSAKRSAKSEASHHCSTAGDQRKERHFNRRSIYLRHSSHLCQSRSASFFEAVVEHFAKEVSADLITLRMEDIVDLTQYFASSAEGEMYIDAEYSISMFFALQDWGPAHPGPFGGVSGGPPPPPPPTPSMGLGFPLSPHLPTKYRFPFCHLFKSPHLKEKRIPSAFGTRPLIVHIPEVQHYAECSEEHPYTPPHYRMRYAMACLLDSIEEVSPDMEILLIATSSIATSKLDANILSLTRAGANCRALRMNPAKSQHQRYTTKDLETANKTYQQRNARALRRGLRKGNAIDPPLTLLEPYAEWQFLSTLNPTYNFSRRLLCVGELDELVDYIAGAVDLDNVRKHIVEGAQREIALGQPEMASKWFSFTPSIQACIAWLEGSDPKFELERQFLDLIVTPGMYSVTTHYIVLTPIDWARSGWDNIELDHGTKETIQQLTNRSRDAQIPSHGILKHGRIGGALLYGPPGTGKTHLARVLASEVGGVLISVLPSDIENKFVGETEKAIKGLFSLARMLAPSIVFFDEADALFKARGSNDFGWERSRISQFLSEMDGLTGNSSSAPFVILASNFPNQLDHAVIRRVPCRLYIGLPSAASRKSIFGIHLCEEELQQGLQIAVLVERTRGFTGSDIHSICYHAARCSEDEGRALGLTTRRIIRMEHFSKAFERHSRTVASSSFRTLGSFAMEHDPSAMAIIMASQKEIDFVRSQSMEQFSKTLDTGGHLQTVSVDVPVNASSTHKDIRAPLGDLGADEAGAHNKRNGRKHLEYIPLQPDSKQIRVLFMEAVTTDGLSSCMKPLVFTLRNVDLGSRTPGLWYPVRPRFSWGDYITLSYVWGEPHIDDWITVDDCEFPVTRNLFVILQQLWVSHPPGLGIWIDAVCINQQDIEERACEVKKMKVIYSEALMV